MFFYTIFQFNNLYSIYLYNATITLCTNITHTHNTIIMELNKLPIFYQIEQPK